MLGLRSDLHFWTFLFILNGGLSPQVLESGFHLNSLGIMPAQDFYGMGRGVG